MTRLDGEYLITYSAYSRNGVRIALAKTKDFTSGGKDLAHHRGGLSERSDLSRKVRRPLCPAGPSPFGNRPVVHLDFLFAGSAFSGVESQLIMRPEPYHWDEMKIGPGAPPIKTDQGWLSIYHGVFQTMDGSVYRLGVALHDLRNPAKIIGVGDSWILQPEDPWEITGYVHNVVFTCGAVAESDGTVKIYWGGADTVMCVGEANIADLVALCLDHARPPK